MRSRRARSQVFCDEFLLGHPLGMHALETSALPGFLRRVSFRSPIRNACARDERAPRLSATGFFKSPIGNACARDERAPRFSATGFFKSPIGNACARDERAPRFTKSK